MFLNKFVYVAIFVLFFNVDRVFNVKVLLLFPKGFSISVDDRPGIASVYFDVNITRNDQNLAVECYSKNVGHAFANYWTFVKRTVALAVGDTITYTSVVSEENDNEEIESGLCKVTELPKIGSLRKHGWMFNYDIAMECSLFDEASPPLIEMKTSIPTASEDMELKLGQCQENMFNSSLSMMAMQTEIEQLRNLTQKLTDFEETYPMAKQLTLGGRIPPEGEPAEIVSFILYEKLNLKPTITSAFRDSTYSIKFMVSTVIDKLEILEAAKYMLANSKITVT
ncbi:hypothetical protein FQR65_LT01680 [Abscondita terminalis]|nr:hypothetical protein FQR65_LT01680 [Abscondita terminalis]